MSAEDSPLILPRAVVEGLYQLLGRLLGEEHGAQSSAVEGDGTCTATIKNLDGQILRCAQAAGHYDESRPPEPLVDDEPGGWHRYGPDQEGARMTWSDRADDTTPHEETP